MADTRWLIFFLAVGITICVTSSLSCYNEAKRLVEEGKINESIEESDMSFYMIVGGLVLTATALILVALSLWSREEIIRAVISHRGPPTRPTRKELDEMLAKGKITREMYIEAVEGLERYAKGEGIAEEDTVLD